jgi:hypothetical protein
LSQNKKTMDRRTFISQWIRLLIIALLAAVSGLAFFREREGATTDCPAGQLCQGCSKTRQCTLPQKQAPGEQA